MKSNSLIVALFILLAVSVSFADPMPVPDGVDATTGASVDWDGEWGEGDTIHCPACGAENPFYSRFCVSCGTEMATWVAEVEPIKHYSWEAGLFGNLIPGLGYFLIDEPIWGIVDSTLSFGGIIGGIALAYSGSDYGCPSPRTYIVAPIIFYVGCASWLGGIIHAPLLAGYKNEQQKVALDLSPGLGLDSEGGAYPTVQLTLSF